MILLLGVAAATLALHAAIAFYARHTITKYVKAGIVISEKMLEALAREEDKLEPGKWWQVLDPDGKLWCETSNEAEARENVRPGDSLHRLYEKADAEWREEKM